MDSLLALVRGIGEISCTAFSAYSGRRSPYIASSRDSKWAACRRRGAAHNQPAISLYRRMGFADYGLDRHALRVNNKYVDEILMKLPLKVGVPSRLSVTV